MSEIIKLLKEYRLCNLNFQMQFVNECYLLSFCWNFNGHMNDSFRFVDEEKLPNLEEELKALCISTEALIKSQTK